MQITLSIYIEFWWFVPNDKQVTEASDYQMNKVITRQLPDVSIKAFTWDQDKEEREIFSLSICVTSELILYTCCLNFKVSNLIHRNFFIITLSISTIFFIKIKQNLHIFIMWFSLFFVRVIKSITQECINNMLNISLNFNHDSKCYFTDWKTHH